MNYRSKNDTVPSFRWLDAAEVVAFVHTTLLSAQRTWPVVALTTERGSNGLRIEPTELSRSLGSRAQVVALVTGDATWALSEALPRRLDVYGGAARIWWPELSGDSDPYDHPLFFVDDGNIEYFVERIIAAIVDDDPAAGRYGFWEPAPRARDATSVELPQRVPEARLQRTVEQAIVIEIRRGRQVWVRVGPRIGRIAYTDEKMETFAARLHLGDQVQVFQTAVDREGTNLFSTQGLGTAVIDQPRGRTTPSERPQVAASPLLADPWTRITQAYKIGDIVRARVYRIEDGYAIVELLPGARVLVPKGEIDWTYVSDPREFLSLGDRVNVKLMDFDRDRRRGTASIRHGFSGSPLPAISLNEGEVPFLADDEPATKPRHDENALLLEVERLTDELDSALADRAELMKRLKSAQDLGTALKKELRSTEDRASALESRVSGALDPLQSETAFLTGVRVEYARRFDEGDRANYPLQRMRVGRDFLRSLRTIDGIDMDKVIEVCAQVACGRAHELGGRSVHELRAGEAGSPGHVRASDGAKAWRCSLQEGTPSARRLHWWDIPGTAGRTIEFANVVLHDDFSITA